MASTSLAASIRDDTLSDHERNGTTGVSTGTSRVDQEISLRFSTEHQTHDYWLTCSHATSRRSFSHLHGTPLVPAIFLVALWRTHTRNSNSSVLYGSSVSTLFISFSDHTHLLLSLSPQLTLSLSLSLSRLPQE